MSQKGVALSLSELEDMHVLQSKVKGNIKFYFLNKDNPLIKKYIILTEIEKSIAFFRRHSKLVSIFEKMCSSNAIVCIFGSYAKGNEKKESDLDLFIVGDIDEVTLKKSAIIYNVSISVKKSNKADFIHLLKEKNPLMNEILEHHVLLSGFERFIEEVSKQTW